MMHYRAIFFFFFVWWQINRCLTLFRSRRVERQLSSVVRKPLEHFLITEMLSEKLHWTPETTAAEQDQVTSGLCWTVILRRSSFYCVWLYMTVTMHENRSNHFLEKYLRLKDAVFQWQFRLWRWASFHSLMPITALPYHISTIGDDWINPSSSVYVPGAVRWLINHSWPLHSM